MFSGLIEEIGRIKTLIKKNSYWIIEITSALVIKDMKNGDSISVDGVCLTVTHIKNNSFFAEISKETLRSSKAKKYSSGTFVNLERALKVGDRIGGHIVLGHVEGIGKVMSFKKIHGSSVLEIVLPKNLMENIIKKSFIAIDGISLTIAEKKSRILKIIIINETLKRTVLSKVRVGQLVNIERDFLMSSVKKKWKKNIIIKKVVFFYYCVKVQASWRRNND